MERKEILEKAAMSWHRGHKLTPVEGVVRVGYYCPDDPYYGVIYATADEDSAVVYAFRGYKLAEGEGPVAYTDDELRFLFPGAVIEVFGDLEKETARDFALWGRLEEVHVVAQEWVDDVDEGPLVEREWILALTERGRAVIIDRDWWGPGRYDYTDSVYSLEEFLNSSRG